jgi:hypothetical protein
MSYNFPIPTNVDPNSENIQENIKIMLLLFHLGRNKDKFIELKQSETSETLKALYKQPIYDPIIELFHNTKTDKQIIDDMNKGQYDNAVNRLGILSELTKTINCIISKSIIC